MKKVLILLFILILISCTNKDQKKLPKDNYSGDTITNKSTKQEDEKKAIDSIKNDFLNTKINSETPVKIISSKLIKNQYSDHKDIQLVYKNLTQKKIKAIKFEWYCENAFDKPASGQFFFVKGIASGHTDILLRPGKIHSKIWEDFSTDAYKIIAVRAYFVVFSDGTKWELK